MGNAVRQPDLVSTVGHGTLPAAAFAALVAGAGVDRIVDVRRYPGSRKYPHFSAEAMSEWLDARGVGYTLMTALGGRRRPAGDETNAGWRNPQFRAYADYMWTSGFVDAVRDLMDVARSNRVAVLCSESVWWRCHRRLLADYLEVIEGVAVEHLFHDGRRTRHQPTAGVIRDGDRLAYPREGSGS